MHSLCCVSLLHYNFDDVSGEHFEKLKDRDDQGWCTGRKNGRVGLYPDNYVKLLGH